MHTTTAHRAAPDQAPSDRPAPRLATGHPGALLSLQQSAGNAAVSGHFTGRLSVGGKATLEGEEAPKSGQRAWANTRVRDLAKATIEARTPTGTDRHIELVIGGEKLVLDLAQGLTGLPPFVISGRFRGARNLTFGTASVTWPNAKKNATVGLDATAWITPAPSKPGVAPPAPAGDAAVTAFTWGGDQARFEDTHKVKGKEVGRSGTLAWKTIVDAEVTGSATKVQAAGFTPTALAQGKALDEEEAALKDAARKSGALRKAVTGDALGRRRAESEKLLAALRTLLGKPGTTEPKDLTDAALITELDALRTAADTRLGGYGKARWHNRLTDLRAGLDDPSWVLGTSGKAVVSDPSPAQLFERGYFTLKQHSTSAPGGKAQPGAFDVPFVKAMVKHGFNHGGNWGTPDFMHFELRWTGPAKKKP